MGEKEKVELAAKRDDNEEDMLRNGKSRKRKGENMIPSYER